MFFLVIFLDRISSQVVAQTTSGFTEASVASGSESGRRLKRKILVISFGWPCLKSFFLIFLLRQEIETAVSLGERWRGRARLALGRSSDQSAAQLEPLAPCAQNSNRCLSAGLGRQLVF